MAYQVELRELLCDTLKVLKMQENPIKTFADNEVSI